MSYEKPELFVLHLASTEVRYSGDTYNQFDQGGKGRVVGEASSGDYADLGSLPSPTSSTSAAYQADE